MADLGTALQVPKSLLHLLDVLPDVAQAETQGLYSFVQSFIESLSTCCVPNKREEPPRVPLPHSRLLCSLSEWAMFAKYLL